MEPHSTHDVGHAALDAASTVIFGWDPMVTGTVILCVAYAFIITERIHRTVISLLGAGVMVMLGVMNQHAAVSGIDFNTIFLLVGMMTIVGITKRSGIFQYVAILTAKLVKGNPASLLAGLAVITAIFSALLDNVTTVMLIVPVTLLLTDQLKLPAYPFLFSQIFASNVGGMATLIGDPPNILIGSAVGFSFMDFIYNTGVVALAIFLCLLVLFHLIWGRNFEVDMRLRARLMQYVPAEALTDKVLLLKALIVMALVIIGFVYGHGHGLEPGTVALTGAALLMMLDTVGLKAEAQSHRVHAALSTVEWDTIFFFIGLFMLVHGVERAGLLSLLGQELLSITDGDIGVTAVLILWASAIFSAIVDNIPFVATMIPLIDSVKDQMGGAQAIEPLWWSLSLGACLGGNGSLVGASANVMVASFAERANQRISFLQFLKLGFPLMLLTIAMAHVFMLLVYDI